jgi:hypothetical protein
MDTNDRALKIQRTTHKKLWSALMAPLKRELANAQVGMRYKPTNPTPERDEAFAAYVACMEKLLASMVRQQQEQSKEKEPMTPAQLAAKKNYPYYGSHWVDWIPLHIKDTIAQAFMQIPTQAKAKRKVPFQRVVAPKQNRIARARLQGQINRALAAAEERRDDVAHLELMRAQNKLDARGETDAIPTSWRHL